MLIMKMVRKKKYRQGGLYFTELCIMDKKNFER